MDFEGISWQRVDFKAEYDFWKDLYPEKIKEMQELVDEECDKLDFEGSFLFADRPGEHLLHKISRNILISLPKEVREKEYVPELVDVLMWNEIYKRRAGRAL